MGSIRLGVDTGGTFTDITVLEEDTGMVSIAKVASRPDDPAGALIEAVEKGIEIANVDAGDVTLLVHGTTIVTNAVLENELPQTSLVTTEGFKDVLEIGRHFRPDMYDLQQVKVPPLVPRERRYCVAERMTSEGEILVTPEHDEVLRLVEEIRKTNSNTVAVCFLNSFINPANEIMVRDWLIAELPDASISASHEVCREIREFERMSTVALNAATMPLMADYLAEISPRVKIALPNAKVLLMQSNGGSLTVEASRKFPVRLITSGPAGGALAVQRLGKATGNPNLLGVDMGGTSTDISLIHKGETRMTTESAIAEHPVKLPMIEINTIGAGAGSIAWLDNWGGLHVGPRSAGADPGPVAYGRGGTEPTVADANIVLGRMHPDRFLGGKMSVDREAARNAVAEKIGKALDLSVEEAAAGILRIAISNMERAVRVSSAERGFDPRDITLVAFGGAGPLHAAELAKAAGIPTVLVPEAPGVFSAIGLVMADIRHDFVQTQMMKDIEITPQKLDQLYEQLDAQGREALSRDGVSEDQWVLQRSADFRYVGQAYEVNIPVPGGKLNAGSIASTIQAFHDLHLQLYAHNRPDARVEFVNSRVAAIGLTAAPPMR
ncbi:MAG: hydantoinase/oxoprolinase family protein, partial [Proteobacteria bacterium]|nr:hydantoinase/oxoprolinase family protein [Pseudomonadota bacterium]